MKILMTGATGVVGNNLGRKLFNLGHELVVISRSKRKADQYLEFPAEVIEHDLVKNVLPQNYFKTVDAVIHLMGETVDGRWNDEKKKAILDSRTSSSQNLIKNLPSTVKVIVSASAQGIYGDRNDEILTENAKVGTNFLADVCSAWEKPFQNLAIRNVQLRIGLVLDSQSGVLKKLIPLFQKGLGGSLGSGDQYMSWIALEDLTEIAVQSVLNEKYKGAINCGTENPVKNTDWTKSLCKVLDVIRSAPVPKIALKIAVGEMADVVLASVRMHPEKLLSYGYKFKFKDLDKYFELELADFKNGKGYLVARQYINQPLDKVFDFFAKAENLEKITPELLNFKIKSMSTKQIQKDTLIDYKLKVHGVPITWRTLIAAWNPPFQFVDTQIKGPYTVWHHTHNFEKMGSGTLMTDYVRYKVPLGFIGRLVSSTFVQKDVESIFKYRREVMNDAKITGWTL